MTEEVINLNEEIGKKIDSLKKYLNKNKNNVINKIPSKNNCIQKIKEFVGRQNTAGRLILGTSSVVSLYFLYMIFYWGITDLIYKIKCGFSNRLCELIVHPSAGHFIPKLLLVIGITTVILFFLNFRNDSKK